MDSIVEHEIAIRELQQTLANLISQLQDKEVLDKPKDKED